MNNKGITLVELLGATVILGIVISLVASVLFLINKATQDINNEAIANREGLLVVRTLEEAMTNFDAKDYSTCGNNCITLESSFTYTFDENLGEFVATPLNPVLSLEIKLSNTPSLTMNGTVYTFNGVVLLNTSSITYTETLNTVRIVITLGLQTNIGKTYQFTANHYFDIQTIPA